MLTCSSCGDPLHYVHGHAACLRSGCPRFGLNQAECCDGETAATCPAPNAGTILGAPGGPPPAR